MLKPNFPCLRKDLSIKVEKNSHSLAFIYLIQKPDSQETFEFGEEEFFLCQCFNGESSTEQIIDNFKLKFGVSISEDDFNSFLLQIKESGLLDTSQSQQEIKPEYENNREDEYDDDDLITESKNSDVPRWSLLKNAEPVFTSIVLILKPLIVIYKLLLWGLIPLFIICLNLWIRERLLIEQSLQFGKQITSFLSLFLLSLILINLLTKVGRGLIATYYGAKVKDFGILIRWGFVPRFYVKIKGINKLNKKQQIFIFGSPLYFRSTLFIIGTFVWYFNLGKGNILSSWGILLAILGLASFIQTALPLRPASSGARIISLLMNKSANYPRRLLKNTLASLFSNNPQKSLSSKEILIVVLGLIITILLVVIVVKISIRFALGLSRSLPNIFGNGTFYIILVIFLGLGLNYLRKIFTSASKLRKSQDIDAEIEKLSNQFEFPSSDSGPSPPKKTKKYGLIWGGIIVLALLLIPIPYSIGGDCQLLPPKQQEIQAPISGKIDQVFYEGGNGVLIKKGTVIANMVSGDLQNQILTLQQQIREQQAQKQQSLANLKKLQQGSRQEEIDIARKQVEVARQEVNVSLSQVQVAQKEVEETMAELEAKREELKSLEQQLQAAIVNSDYSQKEVTRLESLYGEGALPLQRLENSRQQMDTDKIAVAEKKQNLKTQQQIIQQIAAKLDGRRQNLEQVKQDSLTRQKSLQEAEAKLNLVLSGSIPADIEVAQQEVERKNAELNRLQQELTYTQQQDSSGKLVMPFDGYLVESYLDKKEGSYLNQGDTFATAENATDLVAQLKIPEYNVGEIKISAPAQVKLLAYPHQTIPGKIVAIEPTTKEETSPSLVRVFTVQIQLENTNLSLKAGMSGYGKIPQGKKPLIVAITRPLIRFLQIEFWSWLP